MSTFLSPLSVEKQTSLVEERINTANSCTGRHGKDGCIADRGRGFEINRHVHSSRKDGSGFRMLVPSVTYMGVTLKANETLYERRHSHPSVYKIALASLFPSCFRHRLLCRDPPLCLSDRLLQDLFRLYRASVRLKSASPSSCSMHDAMQLVQQSNCCAPLSCLLAGWTLALSFLSHLCELPGSHELVVMLLLHQSHNLHSVGLADRIILFNLSMS